MPLALTEQSTGPHPQHMSEILERCAGGDLSAYRSLVEEYQDYVFALAFRVLCDEEEANDAVQEAFIRVWKNISRYAPEVKFTTWLHPIVTHICYDRLRSKRRKRMRPLDEVDPSLLVSFSAGDNPERLYGNREIAGAITILTEQLPPTQRIVFVLRDLQQLSVREVSGILRISENSVKTNLVHARKYLRQRLKPYIME